MTAGGSSRRSTVAKSHEVRDKKAGDAAANTQQLIQLRFDDNSLLPLLCGTHDRHLAHIEDDLDVSIVPRGNLLSISGPADAIEMARGALSALYDRLTRGLAVDTGEVEAVLRMGAAHPDAISAGRRGKDKGGGREGGRRGGRKEADGDLTIRTRKRHISPRSANQEVYLRALRTHELVFALGPAGTGKTYLAVATAVDMLTKGEIDRIILSRPAVEAGEKLGFLPGDLREKVDPYLRPLYDALHDMMPGDQVFKRMAEGDIEVAPLGFMRGRTLSNAFVILDEAQNTTPVQMKMFLTRLGESSRMVVTGDLSQVDLPSGTRSGLRQAVDILAGIDGVAFITFTEADVMRHFLVTGIVEAYETFEERTKAGRQYMGGALEERPQEGVTRDEGNEKAKRK